jgi:hypothetical protein
VKRFFSGKPGFGRYAALLRTQFNEVAMSGKLYLETRRLIIIFGYLALLLTGFNLYKRMVLTEYHIGYFHFGYGFLEAWVLAKVILMGDLLHIGRRFRDKPLIVPTVCKAFCLSILVLALTVLEHVIVGLFHTRSLSQIVQEIVIKSRAEIFAYTTIIFINLIPLCGIRETARSLGEGKLFNLFFRMN